MKIRQIQFLLSIVFILGYMAMMGAIFYVEFSDTLNMKQGENSLMGEAKILLGAMTAGTAQILNFWFNDYKKREANEETVKVN
jgi:hypothetical protein